MREGKDHQSWLSGQLVDSALEGSAVINSLALGESVVTIRPKADQDPSKLRMFRTPLGVHPRSLLSGFGLENSVVEALVGALVPWCPHCNSRAVRQTVDSIPVSHEEQGFFVLGIAEHESGITLSDQLELLGLDRAIINSSLVHQDDLQEEAVGEAVLAIHAVSEKRSVERSVAQWFERGGGPLQLYVFADRHSNGRLLGALSNSWGCETCSRSYPVITLGVVNAFPECVRCRGEGWLDQRSVSGGTVWQECGDCRGLGFEHRLSHYKVGEVPYPSLRRIPFGELEQLIGSGIDESLKLDLRVICSSGFAAYPLAAPVDLLSDGEKAVMTITIAALSGYRGMPLAIDLAALGLQNETAADIDATGVPLYISATPTHLSAIPPGLTKGEWLSVVGADEGVLFFESLRFPIGEVSLVTGPSGTGKSFLLREIIAQRFSRRKKLSAVCNFGSCNELIYVDPLADQSITLACLLGLSSSIAKSYAATSSARLFGFDEKDFMPKNSTIGIVPEQNGDFDWRLERVALNSVTYPELLSCTLKEAHKVLWADDLVDLVLSRLAQELHLTWTLGMPVTEIPMPHRRFLHTYSAILRFLVPHKGSSRRSSVLRSKRPLILLDRPFAVSPEHGVELRRLMSEVCLSGGTVICADSLQGVESGFNYVVRLASSPGEGLLTRGTRSSRDGKLIHQQLCRTAGIAEVVTRCVS
jgi:hypothetical protein